MTRNTGHADQPHTYDDKKAGDCIYNKFFEGIKKYYIVPSCCATENVSGLCMGALLLLLLRILCHILKSIDHRAVVPSEIVKLMKIICFCKPANKCMIITVEVIL